MHESFQADVEELLNERAKGWERWGFDVLYRDVIDTLSLEESENLTVTAARCVAILTNERNKMRRIDEWNQKQKK